jgi:DUF4097 and DUF4098 domain-containing protein YvlB
MQPRRTPMKPYAVGIGAISILALGTVQALAGDTRKELRLDIAPGGTVNVVSSSGSVNIHGGAGHQVVAIYTTHSSKIEVDQSATSDKGRIELRTHALGDQPPTSDEAKVDYEITVPAGASITVSTATAPITVEGLTGDVTLQSDKGQIVVRNVAKAHVHVRGVTAPVNLADIVNGHVEITSSGGAVQMVNVSGSKVSVGTASGNITYRGDCSGGGSYAFTTHSGAIDVTLPESASVDLTARSVNGAVQNDFPLQAKAHPSFVPKSGSSFAGTSNSGLSSVELQSFSGRIRVKKQ